MAAVIKELMTGREGSPLQERFGRRRDRQFYVESKSLVSVMAARVGRRSMVERISLQVVLAGMWPGDHMMQGTRTSAFEGGRFAIAEGKG